MPSEWPLVGRRRELQEVAAALGDETVGGMVLAGPGGVGKTRLAVECLRIGTEAGYAVARAAATRAAAESPLGALVALLPDLRERPVHLLAAARRSLRERAGDRGLLLFVDDAHLLDETSAALLLSIASEREVFVIVTVRTGEPVLDAITSLWKDGHARRLDLDPLPDDDLDRLAAAILGGEPDAALTHELHRLSRGNPLAVREILLGALEAGTLQADGGRWRAHGRLAASPRLIELVAERLRGLADAERHALELVVLGEPVGLALLGTVAGLDAVERLEQRGLVEIRTDGRRMELWLAHPLHGEIVREQLPTLRRRRLVALLTDALSATGARRRGDVLRLGNWRLELGDTSDEEVLLAAARQSFLALDLDCTRALADAVWSVSHRVEAGHLLGHVLCRIGAHAEAEAVLDEATARAASDRERTLVAMARSENLLRMEDYEHAVAVALEAEAATIDERWKAELRGHRASLVMLHGDFRQALAIVEPMLAGGDERPFVEAAVVAGAGLPHDGRPDDALAIVDRAHAIHERIWEHELFQSEPGVHIFNRLFALIYGGRLAEADELSALAIDVVTADGVLSALPLFALQRARVFHERGHLADALDWYRRSAEHFATQGPLSRRRMAVSGVLLSAAELGDITTAAAAAAELSAPTALGYMRSVELVGQGWLLVVTGHRDEGLATLDEAVAVAIGMGKRSDAVLALHGAARLGDPRRAVDSATALLGQVQGPLLTARLEHVLAAAADDARQLEGVAARFEEVGADLDAAEAWAEVGRALRAAGEGRKATAATHRSHDLAARCGHPPTPALRLLDEPVRLTAREREIALLAADGLSTKLIASRLFLSPRTVGNHLQSVYTKLGVSSREELGAVVAPRQ